jgi:HEAT repeat protein
MSDTSDMVTDQGADTLSSSLETWEDPSVLPVEEVRSLFITMTKALRAFQLYDQNNPVYARFVSALRDAFTALWDDIDHLPVLVEEDRITWLGEEVYRSDDRGDSLAWVLYKDGIRDLTFRSGIEGPELERFLNVLRRGRLLTPEGDDLLNILWEEDLEFLDYTFVEPGVEGVELPEAVEVDPAQIQEVVDGIVGAVSEPEPEDEQEFQPPIVSLEDFSPTLYFLDSKELDHLREEVDQEMRRNVRGDVLAALFDRVEEPERPDRQSEVLGILEVLLPNFLSRGLLGPAAEVLEEIGSLLEADGLVDDERREHAGRILDEISASEAIHELIHALEDGAIAPASLELGHLVKQLRPAALGALIRAAEVVQHKKLRPVLMEAAQAVAEAEPEMVLALLSSSDTLVVMGAARLAGKLAMASAVHKLLELMRHDDAGVRLAAVRAAVELRTSAVIEGLTEALTDADRDVRIAAARGVGALRFPTSGRHLRAILTGKAIQQADLSEMIAFFESYGDVGDGDAVALLGKMLNGKRLLGRREPREVRACAALALGRIQSAEARAALEKARDDGDPVVRNAVGRALGSEESDAEARGIVP